MSQIQMVVIAGTDIAKDALLTTTNENFRKLNEDKAWKDPVDLATTANITLSGEQTIDGVSTSASRVLVKDQTSADENGIYITDAGAWTRATDHDDSTKILKSAVLIIAGTANAGKFFKNDNTGTINVGVDNITFSEISGGTPAGGGKWNPGPIVVPGDITPGVILDVPVPEDLDVNNVRISTATSPDGDDIDIQVYKRTASGAPVSTDSIFTSDTPITITDAQAEDSNGLYQTEKTTIDNGSFTKGNRLVVEVLTVGSTVNGQDLTLSIITA